MLYKAYIAISLPFISMIEEEIGFILDNWEVLSEQTKSILKVMGIAPSNQNGKETNQR